MRDSALPWLAAHLRASGYTWDALRAQLRISYPDDIGLLNHAPALQRLGTDSAAVLMRLFFLESEEAPHRVRRAFTARQIDQLVRAGLLKCRAGSLRARLRIDVCGDHYLLADLRFRGADRRALRLPGSDPVYPPGSDSLMLRDAISADTAVDVLDLCTGSGVQALPYARRGGRVVAIDLNPRAAAIAAANAVLNQVGNLEVREGNLYVPVRGEQFDLIIANPPFVSSPYSHGPAYHAGGPRGDQILRRITAGLGVHLREGGRAFAVSHVALRDGEGVEEIAAGWFNDFPGRAIVAVIETGTPVDLAAAQAQFAWRRGVNAYGAEVQRWVSYLQRHRITQICAILVAAERGKRRGVEVIDAQPRILPLPLSPAPATRIATWLGD